MLSVANPQTSLHGSITSASDHYIILDPILKFSPQIDKTEALWLGTQITSVHFLLAGNLSTGFLWPLEVCVSRGL